MLIRLQTVLERSDLAEQMVLLPQMPWHTLNPQPETNLIVGYSNSPRSQTALDLTLWIAHQTRLATSKSVTVQVVYVADEPAHHPLATPDLPAHTLAAHTLAAHTLAAHTLPAHTLATLTKPAAAKTAVASRSGRSSVAELECRSVMASRAEQFEQADRILWQARCLADEWRGSLKTHLRFGDVAQELRSVAAAESASLLVLGCESVDHPLIRRLGKRFPCPVLGLPADALF
jgi:nucleotide-binding universal stress UspA family protein